MLLNASSLSCLRNARALFKPVSFSLGAGSRLQLSGRNGSGKTSLLRALAGLLPFEGSLQKNGAALLIGHRNGVNGHLTCRENLLFWQGMALNRRVVFFDDIFTEAGLAGLEDRLASSLSQGQRQRLALCRLLIEDAPIWLLDEPSSALDATGQIFLEMQLAKHTAQGGAAIIASHGGSEGAILALEDAA